MNFRTQPLLLLSLVAFLLVPGFAFGVQPLQPPTTINDVEAGEKQVDAFGAALTNQLNLLQRRADSENASHEGFFWTAGGILVLGFLVMRRYIPRFLEFGDIRMKARRAALSAAAEAPANMAAEEKSFEAFAARFKVGPRPEPILLAETEPARLTAEVKEAAAPAPAVPLVSETSMKVQELRRAIARISADSPMEVQHEAFAEMVSIAGHIKAAAGHPSMTSLWQLASALEALANQLSQKNKSINSSSIRTAAAAVDLIETLARPGRTATSALSSAFHVLAVDDDPISRHAVSFSLKKALNLPDLASDGTTALELATKTAYDAIFLDVQMPGMDGFELCKRIHETELNRETPVVFITCQSDFEAREKSNLAGGCDLIGKPFLTFEVTLKALTLVLKNRATRAASRETKAQAAPSGAALAAAT